MSDLRRICLVLAILALTAAPILAYTIYLKDGSQVIAKEKYKVSGSRAIITLINGTETSIAMDQIDVARTNKANVVDYGNAVVIDTTVKQIPTNQKPQDEGPSLSDLARGGLASRSDEPAREPAKEETQESAEALPHTPTGSVDFLRVQRTPFARVDLGTQIAQLLRSHGVEDVAIYEGTAPKRVFLDFTTNSEASVFRALQASAESLLQLLSQSPNSVSAFELFMATDHRQRAGQFLLTPQRAQELVNKQIDLPGFFLKYVEF